MIKCRNGTLYFVTKSRPTKFLGWVVMFNPKRDDSDWKNFKQVAGPFKTKMLARESMIAGNWKGIKSMGRRYVKRKFKSRLRNVYTPACVQYG